MKRVHTSPAVKCKIGCLAILSVIFMLAFCLLADTYVKYNPLYVPILCNSTASNVETQRVPFYRGGGVHLKGTATMVCKNPNRLALLSEPKGNATTIYFVQGNDTEVVGHLPGKAAVLAAQTDNEMTSQIDFKIHMQLLMKIMSSGKPVLIATESQSISSIEVKLYGVELRSPAMPTTAWCGYYKDFITKAQGPTACAGSLEELKLKAPPTEAPIEPFEIGIPSEKALQIDRIWTIACRSALAFLFFVVVTLLCSLAFTLRAACKPGQRGSEGGDKISSGDHSHEALPVV